MTPGTILQVVIAALLAYQAWTLTEIRRDMRDHRKLISDTRESLARCQGKHGLVTIAAGQE